MRGILITGGFENTSLKNSSVDIIFAERTLPHVKPDQLPIILEKARAALKPGGLLVFDMFGPRHAFAGRPNMNVMDAQSIQAMLPAGLELVDIKTDGALTTVIARKQTGGAAEQAQQSSSP